MSDSLNQALPLKAGQKPLKIDEGKLIFGNEEIVLSKGEGQKQKQVYCQIKMKGQLAAFDVGQITTEKFTNTNASKIRIVGFEVY